MVPLCLAAPFSKIILQTPHGNNNKKPGILSKKRRASPHSFLKGSLTLETSMALPIFLFSLTALFYLFTVFPMRAKKGETLMVSAQAMACSVGQFHSSDPYIRLDLPSYIKVPYPALFFRGRIVNSKVTVRAWAGYTGEDFQQNESERMVYVTESGSVYHSSGECNYLSLSIHLISASSLGSERNMDGSRYEPCESCARGSHPGSVYVTDYGRAYHYERKCQGLKRTIRMVPEKEVEGWRACSKCGS